MAKSADQGFSRLEPTSAIRLGIYDYGCYPMWWASNQAGDIDPEKLPLSQQTITRLEKWDAFEEEGIRLWKQLQHELAPNYEVVYFSDLP